MNIGRFLFQHHSSLHCLQSNNHLKYKNIISIMDAHIYIIMSVNIHPYDNVKFTFETHTTSNAERLWISLRWINNCIKIQVCIFPIASCWITRRIMMKISTSRQTQSSRSSLAFVHCCNNSVARTVFAAWILLKP